MPRQLATGRMSAVGRKLAVGRKPVGFINDGKIHVVLDTNVVIYAIEGLFKKTTASQIEKDSLEIIHLLEKGLLVTGINAKLFAEYGTVAERKIIELRASPQDVGFIINLLEKNSVAVRMMVDTQRVSPHTNDDILFDGLSTSYLVSNNLSDVGPSRLLRSSSYQSTLTPSDFLADLRSKRII